MRISLPHGAIAALPRDLTAGLVVFLVALPLCLGIALASGAPLMSGLVAGIVGGLIVAPLSGSHTSVSGPAAGLAAVVAAQIASLGSFSAFLMAVVLAGLIQICLGLFRTGAIAAFFPSSVIKGLLFAIGLILVLKQIPHLVGHDVDPDGEMAFLQPDRENTFSEFRNLVQQLHPGATAIGLASLALLIVWSRIPVLRRSPFPAALAVVLLGTAAARLLDAFGAPWSIETGHLVQVPVADGLATLFSSLERPDFAQWLNPAIYTAALTLALVASLETLLNLEAVDKLDPEQRKSPPNRELIAQGLGNVAAGLLGGIPITSVIVRSSVNINAGGRTKASAVFHGVLLAACVVWLPSLLNRIPLSCLAAILLVTGAKLAAPKQIRQTRNRGKHQFLPFAATVIAVVLTDLLTGVLIGMAVSIGFILNSNLRRPMRRFVEKHLGGNVLHVQLANQVSFLNRAALTKVLDGMSRGGHVLLDGRNTDYLDPDVLDVIHEFVERSAPTRGIGVSLMGFHRKYGLKDQVEYLDHATHELQRRFTPRQVLRMLQDGHQRFRSGHRLTRDLGRSVHDTAAGQYPLAVILSCIDSRSPAELIFDLGVGDIFSVRIAGNVPSRKVLGSIEYACAVVGAKLVLVMGHTRCGAVTTAVARAAENDSAEPDDCRNVEFILREIQEAIDEPTLRAVRRASAEQRETLVDDVARSNVLRTVAEIRRQSTVLEALEREGRIAVVGAMYDVACGGITFLSDGADDGQLPTAPGEPVTTPVYESDLSPGS